MWHDMGGFGAGFWGGGLLHMVVYWGIIILAIVLLVRWLGGAAGDRHDEGETPLQILKKRYARGEIDKEEFERRKRDLEG